MLHTRLEHLANELKEVCYKHDTKISSAESCTGGLLSYYITSIPGSSKYFNSGFITYSNLSKISILNVSEKTLQCSGAVSEAVAMEMALGARKNVNSDFAVSITGIAGPGGSELKPEGLVCFGFSSKKNHTSKLINFGSIGRDAVRKHACLEALTSLIKYITTKNI